MQHVLTFKKLDPANVWLFCFMKGLKLSTAGKLLHFSINWPIVAAVFVTVYFSAKSISSVIMHHLGSLHYLWRSPPFLHFISYNYPPTHRRDSQEAMHTHSLTVSCSFSRCCIRAVWNSSLCGFYIKGSQLAKHCMFFTRSLIHLSQMLSAIFLCICSNQKTPTSVCIILGPVVLNRTCWWHQWSQVSKSASTKSLKLKWKEGAYLL